MSVQQERERFNSVDAPRLAVDVGVTDHMWGDRSKRFAYFADQSRFVVIAGAQEGSDVDLAFALGLTYRGDRRLVLVLQCILPSPHCSGPRGSSPTHDPRSGSMTA